MMRFRITRDGSRFVVLDDAGKPVPSARLVEARDRGGRQVGIDELRQPEGASFTIEVDGARFEGVPFFGR